MKRISILQALSGLVLLGTTARAQTTSTTGYAPTNFGNIILTSTPSNATGSSGVSSVYTSSGSAFTFGTGGTLVNPLQFNYVLTGPNSATISSPAVGNAPASTTNLVFTGPNSGTYTTVSGTTTATGRFGLAAIPAAAPIENVSNRTTLLPGGQTILGFVIGGTMPRRVLIRAVGPGLAAFGVASYVQNPMLSLYRGSQLLAQNDNWGTLMALPSSGATSTGASSGTSSGSTAGSTSGTGSTSGGTSGGTSAGSGSTTGTSSGNGFVSGTLSNGATFTTQLATAADFTSAGAFALQAGSLDSAFIAVLPPGAYTVVATNSPSATVSGSTSGGSSSGTSTISTSSSSTSSGSSTGSTSTSTGSTSSGTGTTTTSSGSTSSGSTSGTGSTGTSSTGSSSGTGSTSSSATGTTASDVLVEVYFIE